MHRFSAKWYLKDVVHDKPLTVFSTFCGGGGSSMGYKRAGLEVLGGIDIDGMMVEHYNVNLRPKYLYYQDIRDFNTRTDLPEELYHLDILDGSPPCSPFSMVGARENLWGQERKFAEGQSEQTLDDLFFEYLNTVDKLRPKIAIAENVEGLLKGKAKGYVSEIIEIFHNMGYEVQIFNLNAAAFDVPQSRQRVFFIANRMGYAPLKLEMISPEPYTFGDVRSATGNPVNPDTKKAFYMNHFVMGDKDMRSAYRRYHNDPKAGKYFSNLYFYDHEPADTITNKGSYFRVCDMTECSAQDYINIATFPQDYEIIKPSVTKVKQITSMSVPPNLIANIATEIWNQWFDFPDF